MDRNVLELRSCKMISWDLGLLRKFGHGNVNLEREGGQWTVVEEGDPTEPAFCGRKRSGNLMFGGS